MKLYVIAFLWLMALISFRLRSVLHSYVKAMFLSSAVSLTHLGFSADEAQKLLAIGAVLLREVFVAERLEVVDEKSRLLNRTAKGVGVEKVD